MQELVNIKIFEGLPGETIKGILNNCPKENFIEGAIIIREGEDSNGKGYIIKSGCVNINIGGKDITTLKTGDIFGEIALLSEEERTATVKAISDVECIIISQEILFEMIDNGNEYINKSIMNRIEDNLKLNEE